MVPSCIGCPPGEIIWKNLAIEKFDRALRLAFANAFMVLLIIFWTVPVGFVGAITNLKSLSQALPFLQWVNKVPESALGLISGLLPAILLSALLALVPIICRLVAIQAGLVTLPEVESQTQKWYFAFQVIQAFLITTFSSGVSTVAKQIIDEPSLAPRLLARNLPRASNFYLSYFILQGITLAASTIFQVFPLLMFTIGSRVLDRTPREKYDRWVTLVGLGWGNTYPKLANLAVVALVYSCIAPLVLGFAVVGFALLYSAFRYNVFYAMTTKVDTKGDAYGRGLQHLTVGVYLAELCLIGLFGGGGGKAGPLTMMIVLFVLTITYQAYLNWVLHPLMNSLSDDLLAEEEDEVRSEVGLEDEEAAAAVNRNGAGAKQSQSITEKGIAGKINAHRRRGGFLAPFLFHGSRSDYPALRKRLRSKYLGTTVAPLPNDAAETAYLNPSITAHAPKLWIVRDEGGISKQEIEQSKDVIEMSDEGARFDEKGRIVWDKDRLRELPIWKKPVEY